MSFDEISILVDSKMIRYANDERKCRVFLSFKQQFFFIFDEFFSTKRFKFLLTFLVSFLSTITSMKLEDVKIEILELIRRKRERFAKQNKIIFVLNFDESVT